MQQRSSLRGITWCAQALYLGFGSLWPLLGGKSFQVVTGRKEDMWLVKAVALLLGTVTIAIGSAGARHRITPEIAWLGFGTSASLAGVSIVNVLRGRISKVYLLDALCHTLLCTGWVASWLRGEDETTA